MDPINLHHPLLDILGRLYLDGFGIDDNVSAVEDYAVRFHIALEVDGHVTQNGKVAFLQDGEESDIITNRQDGPRQTDVFIAGHVVRLVFLAATRRRRRRSGSSGSIGGGRRVRAIGQKVDQYTHGNERDDESKEQEERPAFGHHVTATGRFHCRLLFQMLISSFKGEMLFPGWSE